MERVTSRRPLPLANPLGDAGHDDQGRTPTQIDGNENERKPPAPLFDDLKDARTTFPVIVQGASECAHRVSGNTCDRFGGQGAQYVPLA